MVNLLSKVTPFLAVALLLLPASSQAAKKVIIKAGHGLTEFSAMHLGWEKFKTLAEQQSNGEIVVQVYPNQQLGGDRELTEGAQLGSVTVTSPSSSPLAAFEKDFFILDAPFLFANRAEAYAALDGDMGQALYKKLEAINLIGLAYWENGFRNLTNSRNAVRIPEDVKGLKLRTMENAIHLAAWKALGANPTPMAFGELFTALQQKTVDGQENPYSVIQARKIYEFQKYLTEWSYNMDPFFYTVHDDVWKSFPEDIQKIIRESAEEAAAFSKALVRLSLDDGSSEKYLKAKGLYPEGRLEATNPREFFRQHGVEITILTPEQIKVFREKVQPVFDKWVEKIGTDLYKAAKEDMDAVKY